VARVQTPPRSPLGRGRRQQNFKKRLISGKNPATKERKKKKGFHLSKGGSMGRARARKLGETEKKESKKKVMAE